MRVIRPEEFKRIPRKRQRRVGRWVLIALAVGLIGVGYFAASRVPETKRAGHAGGSSDGQAQAAEQPKTGKLKEFTSDQFKALAQSIKYPNVQSFDEPPSITVSPAADERIRELAEARGYRMTSIPVGAIQKIDEPRLESDNLLQPRAAIAWRDVKAAAAKDGLSLTLISAYRSPEYQRNLFMQRLLAKGVTVTQIAAGQGDAAVNATLGVTAVPGYSRHHTGYTVDMWCEDGSGSFLASSCYKWISADNYKHAKEAGWIPSYPDGVQGQGPEPEPWEYIWAGKENLTE